MGRCDAVTKKDSEGVLFESMPEKGERVHYKMCHPHLSTTQLADMMVFCMVHPSPITTWSISTQLFNLDFAPRMCG